MNKELVTLLLQLLGGVAVIMGAICLACILTPKIARFIEKRHPTEKLQQTNPEDYKVQGAFDPQKLEEYDLNYKIYNKDIYGVDFKNGKKQKRKDG